MAETIKILALIGSCRKNGNTARIVQMIEARMQALAAQHATPLEFETLFQRFGFTVVKEIVLPIIDLPMWEMTRGV